MHTSCQTSKGTDTLLGPGAFQKCVRTFSVLFLNESAIKTINREAIATARGAVLSRFSLFLGTYNLMKIRRLLGVSFVVRGDQNCSDRVFQHLLGRLILRQSIKIVI